MFLNSKDFLRNAHLKIRRNGLDPVSQRKAASNRREDDGFFRDHLFWALCAPVFTEAFVAKRKLERVMGRRSGPSVSLHFGICKHKGKGTWKMYKFKIYPISWMFILNSLILR